MNFPPVIARDIVIVKPAKKRFSTSIVKRKDPRGLPYYWIYGQPVEAEPGTDVYTVLEEAKIAVTPLNLPISFVEDGELKNLIDRIKHILKW